MSPIILFLQLTEVDLNFNTTVIPDIQIHVGTKLTTVLTTSTIHKQ